jgi:hypothetical protein
MHETGAVGCYERSGHLTRYVNDLVGRQSAKRLQGLAQIDPFQVFHGQIRADAVFEAKVVDADYVLMLYATHGEGFTFEANPLLWVAAVGFVNYFDGDGLT